MLLTRSLMYSATQLSTHVASYSLTHLFILVLSYSLTHVLCYSTFHPAFHSLTCSLLYSTTQSHPFTSQCTLHLAKLWQVKQVNYMTGRQVTHSQHMHARTYTLFVFKIKHEQPTASYLVLCPLFGVIQQGTNDADGGTRIRVTWVCVVDCKVPQGCAVTDQGISSNLEGRL